MNAGLTTSDSTFDRAPNARFVPDAPHVLAPRLSSRGSELTLGIAPHGQGVSDPAPGSPGNGQDIGQENGQENGQGHGQDACCAARGVQASSRRAVEEQLDAGDDWPTPFVLVLGADPWNRFGTQGVTDPMPLWVFGCRPIHHQSFSRNGFLKFRIVS